MLSWIIIFVIFIIVARNLLQKKGLNLPGPKPLPLLGNVHQLNKTKLHIQLLDWAKQYGPVYCIWFGRKPVVVLTGSKQIHEALVVKGKDFNGRSKSYILRTLSFGGKDIGFSDVTAEWKVQKKMLIASLKGYGSGFDRIERITVHYTNRWIDTINSTYDDEKGIAIKDHLYDLMYHIINIMALRESLYSKENILRMQAIIRDDLTLFSRMMQFEGFLVETWPLLRFAMPSLRKALKKQNDELMSIFMELKAKEVDMMKNPEMSDGIDESENLLLSRIIAYQMGDNDVPLDDVRMAWVLYSAYSAGIATTSISFSFLFDILAQNPDIQVKIQKEIDEVIGKEQIKLADRSRLPYTQATILEMLRFTSILPTLNPHRSSTDTSIDGNHIPQDTEVWVNAWGLHHDDTLWDKPFEFVPERFLDACGCLVLADHPNRRNLVPFGAGPRVCAGETFALSRMFLILAMFLQKFSMLPFSSDGDQPTYDTRELDMGMLLEPPNYKIRLIARC